MSEIPFHATRMGQRFYEHTVPELVSQIERLNQNLERMMTWTDNNDTKENDDGSSHEEDTQAAHG